MNSLSWLLYVADVSDRITGFVGSMAVMAAVGSAVSGAIYGYVCVIATDKSPSNDMPPEVPGVVRGIFKWLLTFFIVSFLIATLTPSRNTIMLIAASEVGETVLASDQAQKIGGEAGALATDSLKVLRKFINDQLGEAAE